MKTRHGPVPARAVVLAVQPHVAAALLDPDGGIRAPSVNVVFLEYIREQVGHSLDGLGFLSTKGSGRIISGAQILSTMYEVRAPTGHVAISAYAGGAGNPELAGLDNATLVGKVDNELAELLDIKGAPVVCRTWRWALGPPAIRNGLFRTGGSVSARVRARARPVHHRQFPAWFFRGKLPEPCGRHCEPGCRNPDRAGANSGAANRLKPFALYLNSVK